MSETGGIPTLFRPVGLAELSLVYDSKMKRFPPRLPDQPIFYPVLNREYARQIACEWNTKSSQSGFIGYVTQFSINSDFAAKFPVRKVGGGLHEELWVGAEQLEEFNRQIVGSIQTMEAYYGTAYCGFIPDQFGLRGKNAFEQFRCLSATLDYSGMDFICETAANAKSVYLNFPFWVACDFASAGIHESQKQRVLSAIVKLWNERSSEVFLCHEARRA